MTSSRITRYTMFGMIYFSQGATLSFFTALNSLYLMSFGLPMSRIGLIGTIALIPFVLKIFLGMLSDRVNLASFGHRKPYIVIGLFIQSACLIIAPMINPGDHYWWFAGNVFLLTLGQALYDTCTDGLALDTTRQEEEGTVQGIMVGGRALGVVLLSAVLGFVADNASWAFAFWGLALVSLLPLPLVLKIKEPPRTAGHTFEWKAFKAFRNPSVIALGILGALYSLIINAANQIVNPFLNVTYQIGFSTAGIFTTLWGIGVVLGGITGGKLTDRIGQKRAVQAALLMTLFSVLSLAAIRSPAMAWPLVMLFGLAFGFYETVYFAISMRTSDPRIAASMFAILMAIANIGTGIGLGLSGAAVDSIGYRPTFIVIALLNLLALPLLQVIFPQKKPMRGSNGNESLSP